MARYRDLIFEKSVVSLADCPREQWPEVAISGRSNVGKSSLLNRLAGHKGLAKVSQRPGKTQTINFFLFPDHTRLVDLPGYGYAKVPEALLRKWRAYMRDYLENREQLAGIVQLIDCRHEPTTLDKQMVEWLQHSELPFMVVLTKSDKIGRGQRQKTMSVLRKSLMIPREQPVQFFSSKDGEGRREVIGWITGILGGWESEGDR
jgi:GTP-binding protein